LLRGKERRKREKGKPGGSIFLQKWKAKTRGTTFHSLLINGEIARLGGSL